MPTFDRLESDLHFNREALNLRNERQKVLASNVANADTPNYKARDFDFAAEMQRVMADGRAQDDSFEMSTTNGRHIAMSTESHPARQLLYRTPAQPSLDGNTVDMDMERVNFADNTVRTEAALNFMGRKIQGLKAAMQPE
ncbi:flagellar basal-body rod protein FlgB [Pseudomonas nitritireducens]|uniref:Flagellar basal body rod protein FlgB n=1 Tax=Pseudomonas nitroreducens TaxID=46680 RepID=A0A7W7KM61_PSENT|nr:flagellar basal body rod protein FlgB [Pseudomonas nitritireducens]MBB4865362.1 flagellar basal-body rod protein FlgB [Pseudomonas nitritireducens]